MEELILALCLLTAFVLGTIAPVHAEPASYRASELVRIATEKNPALQSGKLGWELAQIDKKTRFYSFFPNLVFQTQNGLDQNNLSPTANPWTSQYSLQFADTLYSPSNNWWTYKEGVLNERFAELSYRQTRDQTLLSLVQKIVTYLDTAYQLQIGREILKTVQTEFSIIQSSYRQGLKSYSDYLRFKGRYLEQEMTVENLVTTRRKNLYDVAELLDMRDEIEDITDDMTGLARHIDERPDEKLLSDQLLEFQKQLADVRTNITKSRLPWEVDLNFGVNYNQYEYLPGNTLINQTGAWETFGLLSFKLQVWDWGKSSRTIQTTRLQQRQLILNQEAASVQSHGRIGQLRVGIATFESQQKTLEEIVRVQDENLKQEVINYRSGKATFLDYSDAIKGVGQAKQTLRDTQLQLKRLRAEALSLKGLLYDHLTE